MKHSEILAAIREARRALDAAESALVVAVDSERSQGAIPGYLDPSEWIASAVAEKLARVTRQSLVRWVQKGLIEGYQTPTGVWFFRRASVLSMIAPPRELEKSGDLD